MKRRIRRGAALSCPEAPWLDSLASEMRWSWVASTTPSTCLTIRQNEWALIVSGASNANEPSSSGGTVPRTVGLGPGEYSGEASEPVFASSYISIVSSSVSRKYLPLSLMPSPSVRLTISDSRVGARARTGTAIDAPKGALALVERSMPMTCDYFVPVRLATGRSHSIRCERHRKRTSSGLAEDESGRPETFPTRETRMIPRAGLEE